MTEIPMANWPKVPGAKGIVWRMQRGRFECRWQARPDIVKRGWKIKSHLLWQGKDEPDEIEKAYIADRSSGLQSEMLYFVRGEQQQPRPIRDGSIAALCEAFLTDRHSPLHKKRYATKVHYRTIVNILKRDIGDMLVSELKGRDVIDYHERYLSAGKITMGATVIGFLRMVVNFGSAILEDEHCARLSANVLSKIRVQGAKPRETILTFEQAEAIIAQAHKEGLYSIAMAQAFQFECTLRQKDVIGEWVPASEPGDSYVVRPETQKKWLMGIKWEEIDSDFVLHHVTSKRGKLVEPDLKLAPLVQAEFARFDIIPAKGPIIVRESTGRPWQQHEFQKQWRRIAALVGVPQNVRNMDSRAGAISEATGANASLDKVRKAATHSNISMTQRYSRDDQAAIAEVMRSRVASRTKRENG